MAEQSRNIALNCCYNNKMCPMNGGLMQDMLCDVDKIQHHRAVGVSVQAQFLPQKDIQKNKLPFSVAENYIIFDA